MIEREQFFALLRNLRWIIILSILLSLLLFLPGQIQELYRIAADDYGWGTVKEFVAFAVIAMTIWFGAFQLTTASLPPAAIKHSGVYRIAPVLLGALPVLGAIVGQILSRPHDVKTDEVGSIFRIENQGLAFERNVLWLFTAGGVVLLLIFVVFAWRMGTKERFVQFSKNANRAYFREFRFFVSTIVAVAILTTAFVCLPSALAQFVGTIGVIALFTICVAGITLHFALQTIARGIPFIPLVFGSLAVVTSLFGCDDHELRPVTGLVATDARTSAGEAFKGWLRQPSRIAEAKRLKEYPVFIVTAQGGGIYAAQNAGRFLARMQDLCPGFRQHLFAISAVSGGSVGAAAFAAALHVDNTPPDAHALAGQTCEKIAKFLNGVTAAQELDVPGAVEQRVSEILKTDFVAPLAAGFLFSDFTELFLPVSFPFFDRARFLEYTLENAGDAIVEQGEGVGDQANLLRADFQFHWAADNDMPALLLNTTDVGSGKRVVISPFDIDPNNPKDIDMCMLANLQRAADGNATSRSLHIPLSAAAFASARFPWLTPAATVHLMNDCITTNTQVRLVDGGYVENSGINTALDLITQLKKVQGSADLPPFRIYLFSLANGDFEDHGSFRFGELLEPVRALFSTQGSRTYISLDRAKEDAGANASGAPSFPTFGRTDITGLFYSLPLGWTLSTETGDIISLSSGRFWDCVPNSKFEQSRAKQSPADCLQEKVYHLLNGDVSTALEAALAFNKLEAKYKVELAANKPTAKIDAQRLLACYEEEWWQTRAHERYVATVATYEKLLSAARKDNSPLPTPVPPERKSYLAYFQTDQINALLQEWDRVSETDYRILAYILGSVSHDSLDFTHTSENYWFRDVNKIPKPLIDRINLNNAALIAAGKPPIEMTSLLGHPIELANAALAYDSPPGEKPNVFGNRPGTSDGWDFRLRGMYQLVGREQYQEAQEQLKLLGQQLPELDLMKDQEALWDPIISARVTFAHFRLHKYQGGRTLFALLNDSALDWKAVRSLQIDMAHEPKDLDGVDARSQMFLKCIGKTKNPSLLEGYVKQFTGVVQ
jgi:hypothetical protein